MDNIIFISDSHLPYRGNVNASKRVLFLTFVVVFMLFNINRYTRCCKMN